MNNYESVCILAQNSTNEQISNMIVKIQNKIAEFSNGNIKIENLGKKKLAYDINKCSEGTYLLFNFDAKPDSIQELERVYRITDDIMKFIVVKKEA